MSSRRRFPSAKAIAAALDSSSGKKQKQRSKKSKKPTKYLSLKLQLNQKSSLKDQTLTPTKKKKSKTEMDSAVEEETQHQLNLFPLYPEAENANAGGDEIQAAGGDDHVAILLETDAADTSTSLQGLLDSTTTTTMSEEDTISPNYSIFAAGGYGQTAPFDQWLVRAAMRSRERDASEERWVSYCEVVEESQPKKKKKKKATKKKRFEQDEVNSGGGGDFLVPAGFVAAGEGADFDPLGMVLMEQQRESNNGLSAVVGLKLDYQEILDAWSDKGSLYVDGGGESPPQTVPDLHDNGSMECCGNVGNLWRVPEMGCMEMEENVGEKEWKLGQREASVLRYKEKRQNRLFSKRIRYEVRKLNAEKRPRLKGRFVKRIGE